MNILIVDDHEENLYLLETILKGSGHVVQAAANGAEALEKLNAGGVELIISDILMPVMDGFQLCRKVKTDESLRHIPFIIYTATYTGPQDEAFAMKIGANRFIEKPCEPDVFMKAVEDVMATAATGSDNVSTPEPAKEEEIFKLYSERLVRKLEQKMLYAESEIQARQEAEEALQISNTRLHLALASADVGLWDWNLETGDAWFSPEWKRQIGYDDHEIPNRYEEWEKRLHPKDHPRILAEVDAYLQGRRRGYHVEFRLRHKDGAYRWIAASGKLIAGTDKGSKRFMGCHVDITERKRTEDELRRYAHIVSSAKDMLALIDKNFVYLSANAAYLQAFGKASDEMIGRTVSDVFGEEFFSTFIRPRAERTLAGENIRFQYWFEFPAAGRKYMDVAYFPYLGPDAEVRGFVVSARDITEYENLRTQLIHAQKMESVGRLAGGVAHDYNNMIGVIMGYAEMALGKVAPTDPLHSDLKEIRSAAKRSIGITRQLLSFARKQTIAPKVLDLNETVEGVLKMLRRLIGEDIDLAWLPESGLWQVKMDPAQIDQILANLCVNARDAIGGVGKVTIETGNVTFDEAYCAERPGFVPGGFVLLAVSDDGCGMDKNTLHHIFEPFFTTKDANRGTGLGLATVYGIVKQNNGFINVYSEPDKGTIFRIYLPQHAGEAEEVRAESAEELTPGRGEMVLLVEDEPAMMKMGQVMLQKLGYQVLAANKPSEAMRLAEEHAGRIHLLITDIVMPEMNGQELAKQLQSVYPDIKVLFMSGYTASAIAHRGVLAEGINFIQKPFSIQDLATKTRAALQ